MTASHSQYGGPSSERNGLMVVLAALVLFSLWISISRIYQVDEAQNAYMAWIMGAGLGAKYYVSSPLYLFPFALLSRMAGSADMIFVQLRLGFFILFWANLMLIIKAGGIRVRSRRGLWTLLGVALLPPLWTYGLEIRHENFILLGILLMWWIGREYAGRNWAYYGIGFVAALMQMCAFKALAYWIPLSLAFLLFPPGVVQRPRWKLWLNWGVGALAGMGMGLIMNLALGTLTSFLTDQANLFRVASQVSRFAPWSALSKFAVQAPLLLALVVIPSALYINRMVRSGRDAWSWEGPLPEILLWCLTTLLLFVNPTPFPYNLLTVTASSALVVIALIRHSSLGSLISSPDNHGILIGLLVFVQGSALVVQAKYLLETTNDRQIQLMTWAEVMTDPAKDTVFDASGLVPTRGSPVYEWFVNLTNASKFQNNAEGSLGAAIQKDAPPVVLPSYRFSYLGPSDIQTLDGNYIALSQDLWVLGVVFTPDPHTWICRHSGRYAIALNQAPGSPAARIIVDGVEMEPGIYVFTAGSHSISAPPGCKAMLQWVGPNLSAPLKVDGSNALLGIFPIPNSY